MISPSNRYGPVIRASGLNFWFGLGELRRQILFDLSMEVYPGEVVLLTGESGSGKTTLLTLVGGLRTVTSGFLSVLGRDLFEAPQSTQVEVRRRIGFIFQGHNLVPHLTALENVQLGLELHPTVGKAEGHDLAADLLATMGVEHRMNAFPDKLSGGQKQRVAIARALVSSPDLILADEPTSALDGKTGREVMELLMQLVRKRQVPVLMVSHDSRIFDIADRSIHMEDGRITSSRQLALR